MAEIPEWDEFVPVAYRKAEKDLQAAAAPSKKSRKNRGQNAAAANKPAPAVSQPTSNPFETILSAPQQSENLDGLTEDERRQYEEMLRMEEAESKAELTSTTKSKKEKWTPLFTAHGNDLQITLPGRHVCQCMCTKHDLVHNCTNCGRIVCVQEGSGPCFTCGQFVCSPHELGILRQGTGGLEAEKLKRQIFGDTKLTLDFTKIIKLAIPTEDAHMAKAEAHLNTLLEYDRTATQRTKMIDDQADYFRESVFDSPEKRRALQEKEKQLRAKRFESKKDRNRKFNLDIAGREFRQDEQGIDNMYANPDEETPQGGADNDKLFKKLETQSESAQSQATDSWSLEAEMSKIPNIPSLLQQNTSNRLRVQDHELQEMTDAGMALSIMQPWASFVTMGVKPHEGRNWYTAHRGKLWIVSGNKLLPAGEVVQEENLVKALTGNDLIVFPVQYQTGFLLGCVDLVDCISQEEYQKRFPGALLKHPYIFIFENPKELQRTFPVESKSKIFKLDYRLHEVAKRQGWKKSDAVWLPESTYGHRFQDQNEAEKVDKRRVR